MENKKRKIARGAVWTFCILALLLYPLRHILSGVDLWDGGYNYTNFRYSGLDYMDSMWYFATCLANEVGSLLMKLPFGDTCSGMNFYTGLIVSFMAVGAFLFCIRQFKMPMWLAFAAELLAVSLCWAPTAMLYSYLTYAFLLAATMLLYQGILSGRAGYLAAAGFVLGINVGNRFSNLVQTGLILAVWIYGFLDKRRCKEVLRQTAFCILGYAAALVLFFTLIGLQFGLDHYMEGILRLFQMTEHAEDYTPGRMLLGMVWAYYDCTYFLKRFALAVVCSLIACLVLPKKWTAVKKVITVLIMAVLCVWLSEHFFYTKDFATYQSVYYPCVTVLTMTLCLSLYCIADRETKMQQKLLGILLILTVLITSLGGNNAIYSSINNMFLVLPGFMWLVWCFCRRKSKITCFPFKGVLLAGVMFLTVQGIRFGRGFIYEEAGGGRNLTASVEGVPVLQGMKTSPEKAEALAGLYGYLQEQGLQSRECILYGQLPGLSYYMEMAPAMNVWSDLRSYDYKVMEWDLARIEGRPVILLTAECARYVSDRDGTGIFWDNMAEQKMNLLCSYIEENEYKLTYQNSRFAVFE